MKLKPLFDRIVLKQIDIKPKNSFGLVLPESSGEKPLIGEVIEVGNGIISDTEKKTMVVRPHDKVLFSKYAGNEIRLDSTEFIVIRQSDILAIIED